MKCPKGKNRNLLVREVKRENYSILSCSGSRTVSFSVLRIFKCNTCTYEWEK